MNAHERAEQLIGIWQSKPVEEYDELLDLIERALTDHATETSDRLTRDLALAVDVAKTAEQQRDAAQARYEAERELRSAMEQRMMAAEAECDRLRAKPDAMRAREQP